MKMGVTERFLLDGCAFIPYNRKGFGDELHVLLQNGEQICINERVQTFLDRAVKYFGGDLVSLRKIYGQVIGRKQQIPLPLTEQLTLVAFKVRKPIGRQGAYGWFIAEQIHAMRKHDRLTTTLYLEGKHEVTIFQSIESCQQQFRHVLLVRQHFNKLRQWPRVVKEDMLSLQWN